MHDHDFRQSYGPDETTLIKSCDVDIHLLTNPKEAKYNYNYTVRVRQGEPQSEWFHVIPSADWKVSSIAANDASGSLQTTVEKQGKNSTKLVVHFRRPVAVGEEYKFSFSYQVHIIAISFSQFFFSSVVYTDSIYHDMACERLIVRLNRPEKGVFLKAHPEADASSNPITYEVSGLRPLDDFAFVLAYKQRRLGKQFWVTAATMLLSILLGAMFRRYIF